MNNPVSQEQYRIGIADTTHTISDQKILLVLVIASILLRLMSAIYQGNTVTDLPGIYDQISYDGLARRVAAGQGFSFAEGHWPATRAGEPTAHWSYLYTIYLAAIYRLLGTYPLVARIIQALIAGIFQTLLMWRIGSRLFGRAVGLIAAALNAIYVYFFYYAGALITETFYITGILWVFDSALRVAAPSQDGRKRRVGVWQWVEFGIAVGITVLLRQVFLIFLPILYLWLWWNVREQESATWKGRLHWSAVKGLSLATFVIFLLIVPWTIRNYYAFGTFVLLNTNAGFAFYWANHPIYGTRFIPLLPSSGPNSYFELIPKELLTLNEAKLDQALLVRGMRFVVDNPSRYFWLSLSRIPVFFEFWPSTASGLLSNISRVASFGICLPFMVYGLWLTGTRAWNSRRANERAAIVLLLIFVGFYSLIHLLSWALVRYRLPIDAVLLIFAALGIESMLRAISER
jgi:4-amino-4-deoxy-L-arabinose transferase-like glycosyltransferase